MPNTKDADLKDVQAKILLYAPSGWGKTLFLRTMPAPRYMLNFDKENIVPLMVNRVDVEYIDIDTRHEKHGYEEILKQLLMLQERLKRGEGPKTVCIDTGRDFYRVVMYYILKIQSKEMPTQPDWGLAHERFLQRINDFLELNCHLLVNFHQAHDKDEYTGRMIGSISLPGKDLPSEVFKKFNLKLHGVTEPGAKPGEEKRIVHTRQIDIFPADDKFGVLDVAEPPDFQVMWRKIEAKLKSTKPEEVKVT